MMGARELELVIIRHGQTPGNALKRYVGCRDDQSLSELGRQSAHEAAREYEPLGFDQVERVYVTRLRRTCETAAILFPNAEQLVVDGIEEMDFGDFTGRSADEMVDDVAYRAWVDGWCEGTCPGGENRAQFAERVCAGMKAFLDEAWERGEREVFLVAHGGTLMSFLSRYSDDDRTFYEWLVGNCQGYRMNVSIELDDVKLGNIERL